jgi:hypothetical protein
VGEKDWEMLGFFLSLRAAFPNPAARSTQNDEMMSVNK